MRQTALLLLLAAIMPVVVHSQTVDRTKPPQTPPIPDFKLPSLYETSLPNGLKIVLVEDARFPLVTLRLAFLGGSKFDPPSLPGLSESTAALLTEGTKTRSSRQIAEELAEIGGTLNGASGPDGLTLAGSSLADHAPKLIEILADVIRNASFPADEVELRKQNRKEALRAQRSQPSFLADEKLAATVFGSHPYSHIAPTMESLERMDQKALANFRDTYLVPNNATLVLLGRLPGRQQTLKLVRAAFEDWKQKALPAAPKAEFPAGQRGILLVDRPGSVQADIHVGQLAVTRSSPEFFPLMMASTILGGGTNSRMFRNIREKEGFAYDAHSFLDTKRDAGVMTAITQVRNDVIEPAMQALLTEMEGMAKQAVPAGELSASKNFVSGVFLLRLETQDGLATQLSNMKILGLPNSYLEHYTSSVRSVEPDQIQAVARKYIAPGDAAIVVVGDASKISKPLEKFGKVTVTKAN